MESKRPYRYTAYGLGIRSDIRLSELIPSQTGDDIRIQIKKLDNDFLDEELRYSKTFERIGCTVRISADRALCDWKGIGKALVRDGNQVLVDLENGVNDIDFAPYLTGAILGNLLTQRGLMVLHGSAVTVNGEGIAFLGEKGAGKSTLALHLQNRGHNLITDDLVPISFEDEEIHTVPGFPRIRLWSDSVKSVGLDPDALPQINSFLDKRSYECLENFSNEPVKIRHVFVLTEDDTMGIDQLDAQESFIEIVKNTYLNRYLQVIDQTAVHFRQCESIVKAVPVFRLRRPHDFGDLSRVAELVENFDKAISVQSESRG